MAHISSSNETSSPSCSKTAPAPRPSPAQRHEISWEFKHKGHRTKAQRTRPRWRRTTASGQSWSAAAGRPATAPGSLPSLAPCSASCCQRFCSKSTRKVSFSSRYPTIAMASYCTHTPPSPQTRMHIRVCKPSDAKIDASCIPQHARCGLSSNMNQTVLQSGQKGRPDLPHLVVERGGGVISALQHFLVTPVSLVHASVLHRLHDELPRVQDAANRQRRAPPHDVAASRALPCPPPMPVFCAPWTWVPPSPLPLRVWRPPPP
jgi:hypothetical protein